MSSEISDSKIFDVIVLGATPGGIAAAVSAARLGRSVLLVEYHSHLGGMSTSGLGKSDVEKRHLIGGIFSEFTGKIEKYYRGTYGEGSPDHTLCRDGLYFEPFVAETVFSEMIAECENVVVLFNHRSTRANTSGNQLRSIEIVDRSHGISTLISASIFIDASYEGDLLAAAGAAFRLGREAKEDFNEAHAGHIYFDYETGTILPGSTGEGDQRLPAYTYRLCLSTESRNSVPFEREPEDYDRENYFSYFEDLAAGRLSGPKNWKPGRGYEPSHFDTMMRALSVTPIPNGKTDVNINPRPLGFLFGEENEGYIEGDEATRLRICRRIRNLTLGLLYFLQNDPAISEEHRGIANRYHPARDEFSDNDHFPFQLYIREARRLIGEYTLTENDITYSGNTKCTSHEDTIAIGEFPIDSFPCRKKQDGDDVVLEGYLGMLDSITRPYEIPYRIMIPGEIDSLIVPVAASTTHVAFSSIRMEPTWMALGQAAGTAAHLAIKHKTRPRDIPMKELQSQLTKDGQIIEHFETPIEPVNPHIL